MLGRTAGASGSNSSNSRIAGYQLTDHFTPIKCTQFLTRYGGSCFAFPLPLLDLVRRHLKNGLSRDDFEAECSFSEWCDRLHLLGYWNNAPIFDPYSDFTGKCRSERHADKGTPSALTGNSGWTSRVLLYRLGFVGWLLTNKSFRKEQTLLFSKWKDEIGRGGFAGVGQPPVLYSSIEALMGGYSPEFSHAVQQFLKRWRLTQLIARDVPVPMEPLTRGFLPASVASQVTHTGGVFYLPDTFPVPSRDELRDALREGLAEPSSGQLDEWLKMLRRTDRDGKRIRTLARLRVLHSYWRALFSRHGKTLKRQNAALMVAFAEYLECDEATIKRSVRLIKSRLGCDWVSQE